MIDLELAIGGVVSGVDAEDVCRCCSIEPNRWISVFCIVEKLFGMFDACFISVRFCQIGVND